MELTQKFCYSLDESYFQFFRYYMIKQTRPECPKGPGTRILVPNFKLTLYLVASPTGSVTPSPTLLGLITYPSRITTTCQIGAEATAL